MSFRYSPMRPDVVRDVSIDIEPGSFVALVGSSGAGKSTLAMLLMGLYRPTGGRILYDGVDLETLDLVAVRRQLMRADKILVMENGAIAEHGRHDELVAAGGRYAELLGGAAGFSPPSSREIPAG